MALFIRGHKNPVEHTAPANTSTRPIVSDLYADIFQQHQIQPEVFYQAYEGFCTLLRMRQLENDSLLSIIDFSKDCNQNRFFVVDLKNRKLLKSTLVAHGQMSGLVTASTFSNKPQSHQSSLGFFITDNTYFGKHGLSLRIDGLEPGINDKARERAIVIHAAAYVSEKHIKNYGRIGRSFGCPALPLEDNATIIQLIKGKSCLFAYHPSYQKNYDAQPGNNSVIAWSSFE